MRPRPWLHQKLRDRDLRLQILCILPIFFKKHRHHFWLEFFSNFWHFSDVFWCCLTCVVLPANTANKKSLNYRNFNNPFFCNIQSLETWNLRDRDETWNLRDRCPDSQKCEIWLRLRVQKMHRILLESTPVSSEISDFAPCTHAQSNILHTKYADKNDY